MSGQQPAAFQPYQPPPMPRRRPRGGLIAASLIVVFLSFAVFLAGLPAWLPACGVVAAVALFVRAMWR